MTTDASPSTLIVGAGVFGTSTAYHLSLSHNSPTNITVLDRSPYPPHHAASTDINKIVRTDYTSRFYMELAYEALDAWKTSPVLKDHDGRRFFHESGWIMLGNEDSDLAERIRKNFSNRGSDLTRDIAIDDEIRNKWNGILKDADFRDPKIGKGYWNPDAGWADAGDAVQKMMDVAVTRGVKYECGDVQSIIVGEQGVRGVRTTDGRIYNAEQVLLATGAWTSKLLSSVEDELGILDEGRIEKQVTAAGVCVVHYKLTDDEYDKLKEMPVVIYGDRGEVLPPAASTRLLKFTNARSFTSTSTTISGHKLSAPPTRPQTTVSRTLMQETLERMALKTMPDFASRTPDYWRLCWDAITPSQDQLITKHPHPRLSNLYLAVGGSFHSWKFLPTIGKYVVNVLQGVSNGEEKDKRWEWKTGPFEGRGAHEKVVPKRELSSLDDI
ncbi:FAD dependent oxidoreductase [Cucurbitaria berberidis CBS 394.84]|uniref:FAD dependent oxidoreductase n=1 Tax=Cucurbitaria berberidis CBS 394.84 TaxID=1168544 RepID=A0A9P4GT93_9PLEO|nr:FAD dependent oxidoreductase [Cucurbitaria berberidis CBS 394.84]KAF1851071.1 FAD dependent oxidoreductase [Cucurbitaria berberidis CBS 394.84]